MKFMLKKNEGLVKSVVSAMNLALILGLNIDFYFLKIKPNNKKLI